MFVLSRRHYGTSQQRQLVRLGGTPGPGPLLSTSDGAVAACRSAPTRLRAHSDAVAIRKFSVARHNQSLLIQKAIGSGGDCIRLPWCVGLLVQTSCP
jgi:hypothetical protein